MKVRVFFLTAIGVLLLVFKGSAEKADRPEIHNFKNDKACGECHTVSADRQIEESTELKGDPVKLCLGCHSPGGNDHPVDFVPERELPEELPLSKEGKLVCHTCHDPHNRSGISPMLQMEPTELCLACHPK